MTELLLAWSHGDEAVMDELMPLVYGELHASRDATWQARNSRPTLNTAALISEAYLRLVQRSARFVG